MKKPSFKQSLSHYLFSCLLGPGKAREKDTKHMLPVVHLPLSPGGNHYTPGKCPKWWGRDLNLSKKERENGGNDNVTCPMASGVKRVINPEMSQSGRDLV